MKNYIKNNKITLHFNETPFEESFKVLNKKTKKAQYYIERFKNSNDFDIYDCYGKPSDKKTFIFYYWKRRAKELGASIKIIGFNCNFFSIAFNGKIENKNLLFIATPSYNYVVIL